MRVCGYVRLSKDEDQINYTSIESQQLIIREYAKEKLSEEITKFYIDDNVSGYSFNRPSFNQMKIDLDENKIDIIIAKDLSRVGRHNARVLLFIEEMQLKGKRIILPQEGRGYDSSDEFDGETIGISTWINEKYLLDVSRKVKNSIKAKQKNGTHIVKDYVGYIKDPNDKHKLFINEDEAWIVRLIFEKYLGGMGARKIVNYLSDNHILTPSEINKSRAEKLNKPYKGTLSSVWTAPAVNRIINNSVYIGRLVLRKTKSLSIKGKTIILDKADNYVFENHHELIISKEDFDLAQELSDNRKKSKCKGGIKNNYIFSGLLYCKECKSAIMGHMSKQKVIQYVCPTYHNRGKKYCESHRISQEDIIKQLTDYFENTNIVYKNILEDLDLNKNISNYDSLIKKVHKEITNTQNELKNIIMQKIRDISSQVGEEYRSIVENSYHALENEKKDKLIKLNNQIQELNNMNVKNIVDKIKTNIDKFNEVIETKSYTSKLMNSIIRCIIIDKDLNLNIKLKNEIANMLENSIESVV